MKVFIDVNALKSVEAPRVLPTFMVTSQRDAGVLRRGI